MKSQVGYAGGYFHMEIDLVDPKCGIAIYNN